MLDDAVELFLTAFRKEFPDKSFKPEMHFLEHYGMHCRMFGPLTQYWSFRLEGKHSYFKDLVSRLKCRKNVLYTLAKKHQYFQSWHLQRGGSYLHDSHVRSTSGKLLPFHVLLAHIQTVLRPIIGADSDQMVFQATPVETDGLTYECDLAVITGVDNGDVYISVTREMFTVNSKLYTVGSRLENQSIFDTFTCTLVHSPALVT
jgi:hypothetical protein